MKNDVLLLVVLNRGESDDDLGVCHEVQSLACDRGEIDARDRVNRIQHSQHFVGFANNHVLVVSAGLNLSVLLEDFDLDHSEDEWYDRLDCAYVGSGFCWEVWDENWRLTGDVVCQLVRVC